MIGFLGKRSRRITVLFALIAIAIAGVLSFEFFGSTQLKVPSVIHENEAVAVRTLKSDRLNFVVVKVHHSPAVPPKNGSVIAEMPEPGSPISNGDTVTLYVYSP